MWTRPNCAAVSVICIYLDVKESDRFDRGLQPRAPPSNQLRNDYGQRLERASARCTVGRVLAL